MCGLTGIQTIPPDHAVVPPRWSAFSNTPTRAPPSAAVTAAVSPPAPEPRTTTSYSVVSLTSVTWVDTNSVRGDAEVAAPQHNCCVGPREPGPDDAVPSPRRL